MIYAIRYYGDPVLRRSARPVTVFDEALHRLAEDMLETMYHANGIGLAAPQIGIEKRLFVALETVPVSQGNDEAVDPSTLTREEKKRHWGVVAEHVMVNPEVVGREGEQHGQDGCLSVPGLWVEEMQRDQLITLRYQDLRGEWQERTAEGRFAHVLQHELDHLEGILFFDRLPQEDRRIFLQTHRTELADIQRDAKALLRRLKEQSQPTPLG